jgi:hypothetical protein
LADNDNKDLADHPREDKAEGADKALDLVVLVVLVDRLADLAVPEDQAQNVLVGLISKGQ